MKINLGENKLRTMSLTDLAVKKLGGVVDRDSYGRHLSMVWMDAPTVDIGEIGTMDAVVDAVKGARLDWMKEPGLLQAKVDGHWAIITAKADFRFDGRITSIAFPFLVNAEVRPYIGDAFWVGDILDCPDGDAICIASDYYDRNDAPEPKGNPRHVPCLAVELALGKIYVPHTPSRTYAYGHE